MKKTVGWPQRATLARGFNACWIYEKTGSASVSLVCFRHDVVAFKTGPGVYSKVLRALNRASRDR